MRIAYLCCHDTHPASAHRRPDAYEHDQIVAQLRAPLSSDEELDEVIWNDPTFDPSTYDVALIGTTWDYTDQLEQFLDALYKISEQTVQLNPLSLVEWNTQKTYLRELEELGAPVLPTIWLDQANDATVHHAFDELEADRIVLKQQVGANSKGQYLLRRDDPIPPCPHPMMVQAFEPAIQTEGEYSFIFIENELSHALIKRPGHGDYRIQASYGGTEEAITPSAEDIDRARSVLAYLPERPLYARVDMIRNQRGNLRLMELELIEPFLYPMQGPDLGEMLIRALRTRLA